MGRIVWVIVILGLLALVVSAFYTDTQIMLSPLDSELRFTSVEVPENYILVAAGEKTLYFMDRSAKIFRFKNGEFVLVIIPDGHEFVTATDHHYFLWDRENERTVKYNFLR